MLPFAGVEHVVHGHEHALEKAHAGALAVLAAEQRVAVLQCFSRAAGRAGDDGQAWRVDRHRAADGKVGVFAAHVAAGHDQQLVHVGRTGHDGLGAADDDAALPVVHGIALDDAHITVRVALLERPQAAVALGVGHGHAQGQVLVLHAMQVVQEARGALGGATRVVNAGADLADGIERVVRQVALRAAGLLAHQAHGFELVEQVAAAHVDVAQPVHHLAAAVLQGRHQAGVFRLERVVVGEGDGVEAGLEGAFVSHAGHAPAIHKHGGAVAAQGFAVVRARHQAGGGGSGGHGQDPSEVA